MTTGQSVPGCNGGTMASVAYRKLVYSGRRRPRPPGTPPADKMTLLASWTETLHVAESEPTSDPDLMGYT